MPIVAVSPVSAASAVSVVRRHPRSARARRAHALAGLALAFAALVACGPSGPGDDGGDDDVQPGAGLRLEPATAELVVADATPATQRYRVILTDAAGAERDVSDDAALSLGLPSLGSFAGPTLTTAPDRGGRTIVTATWGGMVATGDLTIRLRQVIVEPGVPADGPGDFDAATAGGAAPALVYPDSGVIVPPNLNTMEVHFQPGGGNDVFQLTVTGSALELVVYLTCQPLGGGCVWDPSQTTWDILATAGRGDEPLAYKLRGLDHDAAAPRYGETAPRTLQFAADDVDGGLYYWAAGAGAIMRYDFGRRGQSAERFLGVGQTGGRMCVGCHTLSRDGSKIAVGLDIPGPAALETYTVGTRARLWSTATGGGFPGFPSANGANFFAFSPDASRLVSSDGRALSVRNADDGAGLAQVVANATMPDWSPDGARVVFARPASAPPAASPGVSGGSIVSVDAASWGGEQTLVASAGENNYYPSYGPDSAWVAFNRSMLSDSFDAADARVMVVAAQGGAPIALARATSTAGDSWPKWAPLAHTYAGGTVHWLTVSSRRPYGLRGGTTSQLWMMGFDPARAAAGEDPSFAAFWLPFQDPASGNHIAQWVEHVDRQPCTEGTCPSGEFCEGGYCVPFIP